MKERINLFLASELEYRRGLAHELLDKGIVDFCLASMIPYTNLPEPHDSIVPVDITPSGDSEYSLICDINEFPSVDMELIEKLKPYESMAIKMGVRRSFSMPICEYEDEKRKYLQHVRYWNHMLDKYSINLIVTHCVPHSQGMYVVYSLAKVKNIPILIFERNGINGERKLWGDSIETIGSNVGEKYLELTQDEVNDYKLDEDIQRDFFKLSESMKNETPGKLKRYSSNWEFNRKFRRYYYKYWKMYMHEYCHYNLRAIIKPDTVSDLKKREVWLRLRKKQLRSLKYYWKTQCYSMVDFNNVAQLPDYSKQYICFFLQVYPEQTVIPRAGAFAEQYNSIQMLARAAEKAGCYVYVREHPAAISRPKDFYAEIKDIKNVIFIKTEVSSVELIKNSIAVATQTGTCSVEAGMIGKPAIVFGNGCYYKNCPCIYSITNEVQGAELIDKLKKGINIDIADMRRYFYAIQLESVKEVDVEEELRRVYDDDYKVPPFPMDDRIELIKRFISSHVMEKL